MLVAISFLLGQIALATPLVVAIQPVLGNLVPTSLYDPLLPRLWIWVMVEWSLNQKVSGEDRGGFGNRRVNHAHI